MRLQTTISLYAGGVGSGCHGDNCGRHEMNAWLARRQKLWDDILKKNNDELTYELEVHGTPSSLDPMVARRMAYQREQALSTLQPDFVKIVNKANYKDKGKALAEVDKWWNQSKKESDEGDYANAIASQEIALTMHQIILKLSGNG